MSKKTDALKKTLVAFGYGAAVTDYSGKTTTDVLKEFAVKAECAPSVADIHATGIVGVLNFITNNKGVEEKEPFDLIITDTNATVTVKRAGTTITEDTDILYNGDKLTITAAGATGYDLTTLTVNGTAIESGDTFTVNGHHVTIVATGTIQTFDLARTVDEHCTVAVTKGGNAVNDGEGVLTYGDTLTITATASEGYEIDTLTVNGTAFESGSTHTVGADVAIVATSKTEEAES